MLEGRTPETIEEFNKLMIAAFHESAEARDLVYNAQTAEWGICCTSDSIFACLSKYSDEQMVAMVRRIASTIKRKK